MNNLDKSSDQDDSKSSKNCFENPDAFVISNEKTSIKSSTQIKLATINELPNALKLDQSDNSNENKNCSLNNSNNLCEIESFRKENSKVNLDKSFFCKQDTVSTRQDNSFNDVKSPSIFTRKKPREMAVELKNLSFSYGKGKKQVKILNDIKLRVPLGGIYGLLGPSGCGKTSLLKMVVGLKKPKQGIARVFGTVPGFKNSFIPGPGLGYMPQEIALFQDLTVAETLIFYSKIYRMKSHLVPERIEFLLKLLDLEQKGNRLIRQLSGGQKRRVSLAAAMVHSPPLVILDEPTVGVDPLLRQSIWDHLVRLVKEISLTVIITTHYIEEARQANTVGLMRFGRILVESNPEKLLKKYSQTNLEDVFLKLCLMDEKEFNHNDSDFDYEEEEDDDRYKQQIKFDKDSVRYSISGKEECNASNNEDQLPKVVVSDFSVPISPHIVKEKENFNESSIFVDNNSDSNKTFEENFENNKEPKSRVPLSPLNFETISKKRDQNLQIVGRDRSNSDVSLGSSIIEYDSNTSRETNATPIKLATLNQDFKCKFEPQTTYKNNVKISVLKIGALFYKNITLLRRNLPLLLFQFLLPSLEIILFSLCIGADPFNIPIAVFNQDTSGNLSQRFLESIDGYTVNQINKPTLPLAIEAARNGEAWGAIAFKQNFSSALSERFMMGLSADNHTIDQSNIYIFLDMTNQLIGYKLQRTFLESFRKFSKDLLTEIDSNPDIADLPIKIGKPIYGDREPTFTEFMAPGVVLTIAFLATVALTALAFVVERKDSIMERILVAGVTPFEFLMSHVVTQICVIVVQVALLLIFTFLVFDIPSRGPFIWVILLTLLQAICGMEYGLLISSLCENETAATMLALGSFYPNLLLSGTVWPTQAMPDFMRYFSYILPQTIPIESMRYILSRGWDPSHPEVALGFVITIAWTIIFMIATVFAFKKTH